jgi:methionine-S-sulfoxide reductase
VGYTGGTSPAPTYHRLGDHTETIQIDYDPAVLSYDDLLAIFWESHDAASAPWSRQYMSAVFHHSPEQRRLAKRSRDRERQKRGGDIHTVIQPLERFFPAEPYHQKHQLRRERDLLLEFEKMFPDSEGLMNSTAAARVNGYLAGHGSSAYIETHGHDLGLSPEGNRKLLEIFRWKNGN